MYPVLALQFIEKKDLLYGLMTLAWLAEVLLVICLTNGSYTCFDGSGKLCYRIRRCEWSERTKYIGYDIFAFILDTANYNMKAAKVIKLDGVLQTVTGNPTKRRRWTCNNAADTYNWGCSNEALVK